MAQYTAHVAWAREGQDFLGNQYSRRHLWRFDGGIEVPGSSSPHLVPLPMSDASAVDPEEAFIAALSSCHMLWFLSLAAKQRFCVEHYADDAEGVMARNEAGRMAMTRGHPATAGRVLRGAPANGGAARSAASSGPRRLFHRQLGED